MKALCQLDFKVWTKRSPTYVNPTAEKYIQQTQEQVD
jgi:hypothetical protein